MKKIILVVTLALFSLPWNADAAKGGNGNGNGNGNGKNRNPGFNRSKCVRDSNSTRNSCIRTCQNSFKDEQRICSAKDAAAKACLEGCVNNKTACVETAKIKLLECITAANLVLDSEMAACAALTVVAERYACENVARIKAYTARLECQTAFKQDAAAQAALGVCKTEFSSCIKSCRNVQTPTPTPAATPLP